MEGIPGERLLLAGVMFIPDRCSEDFQLEEVARYPNWLVFTASEAKSTVPSPRAAAICK
jgi:hypothetical protein